MGLVYRNEAEVVEQWCARLIEQEVDNGEVEGLA
jgi:hypothetical protein